MNTETTVALIALAGVFLSAVASSAISVWQRRHAHAKYRDEMMREFGVIVFEKRMAVYPQLYGYLSDFVKLMEFGGATRASVAQLFQNLQAWDSQHSILFSSRASRLCYKLRHRLYALAKLDETAIAMMLSVPPPEERFSDYENLLRLVAALELALKNELGAYAFEGPARVKHGAPPTTYREAEGPTKAST